MAARQILVVLAYDGWHIMNWFVLGDETGRCWVNEAKVGNGSWSRGLAVTWWFLAKRCGYAAVPSSFCEGMAVLQCWSTVVVCCGDL